MGYQLGSGGGVLMTGPVQVTADTRLNALLVQASPADLDTIALKAIEVDPERRYQSVEQLAADVQRYLERARIRSVIVVTPLKRYCRLVSRNLSALAS